MLCAPAEALVLVVHRHRRIFCCRPVAGFCMSIITWFEADIILSVFSIVADRSASIFILVSAVGEASIYFWMLITSFIICIISCIIILGCDIIEGTPLVVR